MLGAVLKFIRTLNKDGPLGPTDRIVNLLDMWERLNNSIKIVASSALLDQE